jgi:hypothetical protein
LALLEREQPTHVLEVGLAAGGSTLMMLAHPPASATPMQIDSVDLRERYFADETKRVGYLVDEHCTDAHGRWSRHAGLLLAELSGHLALAGTTPARRYDLAFVDANHAHPWPTLDALVLLPWMQPGSWVAFHDIALPLLGDFSDHGAMWLLTDWTGEALVGWHPRIPNIGAIRLEDAGAADAERLVPALARPWQTDISPVDRDTILESLGGSLPSSLFAAVRGAFVAARGGADS